jgi:hypothetical protein
VRLNVNEDGTLRVDLEPDDEHIAINLGEAGVWCTSGTITAPGPGQLAQVLRTHPTARAEVQKYDPAWALPTYLQRKGKSTMSHERLAALIQAHQDALEMQQETRTTQESILSILQALASHEITKEHALRLLGLQALEVADEPTQAALYRQAAADLRQL